MRVLAARLFARHSTPSAAHLLQQHVGCGRRVVLSGSAATPALTSVLAGPSCTTHAALLRWASTLSTSSSWPVVARGRSFATITHGAPLLTQWHAPHHHNSSSIQGSHSAAAGSSCLHTHAFSTSSSCGQVGGAAGGSRNTNTTGSTASSSNTQTSSSSSSNSTDSKLQVPPAVAAGAAAAGDAASKAAKAVAKQASRLVKLVQSTSLSEATWLQLSSIWQSHSTTITAATAAAATAGLYQLTAALAGHFVSQPADPSFYYSCLGASAAAVALAGLQIRSSFTVDPERVYRITMRKLNRHAGLQEVMGAPLAGSDVRLELVTQGSLFVQETLLPKRRAPRIHLMFQLTGPTKTGVVSVVAKKAFGSKYAFKTLMVELPDKTLSGQAAAAAAAAALSKAQAHPSAATPPSSSSSSSNHSNSNSAGTQQAGAAAVPRVSSSSSTSTAGAAAASSPDPARIFLIGSPTSSQVRHQSPAALLDDLKDPLLYALKHNLPGCEAEDESEGQLAAAWSKPQHDPDQTTWWDDGKKGAQLLACRTLAAARTAGAAAAAAARTAAAKLRAQAAASASAAAAASAKATPSSSSTTTSSSTSGTPSSLPSGTAPAAPAVAVSVKPQSAATTVDASTQTPASGGSVRSPSSAAAAASAGSLAGTPPTGSKA